MDEKSKIILIVEDEPLIRMCAVELAEDAGYVAIDVGNAEAAREVLAGRSDIAVVFTDINLPGAIDGADLAQEIAEDRPEIRILIASGKPPPPALQLSPRVIFLPKPYGSAQLIEALDRLYA